MAHRIELVKAIVFTRYGSLDGIELKEVPKPGERYDLIIDCQGFRSMFDHKRALRPRGTYANVQYKKPDFISDSKHYPDMFIGILALCNGSYLLCSLPIHAVRLPGYVILVDAIFAMPDQKLLLRYESGSSPEPLEFILSSKRGI